MMRWCLLAVLLALGSALLCSSATKAQSESIPDLQARIDAAAPGALLDVPYGVYPGALTVAKPLHLRGLPDEAGRLPVINGQGQGTVLTITASDATVEGFEIRGSGNVIDHEDGGAVVEGAENVRLLNNRFVDVLYGIRGVEANGLQIRNNEIRGKDLHIARRGDSIRIWQSENCLIEGNTVENARDAIFWFSDGTTLRNNRFRNSRYGVHMMYTDGMTVTGNEMAGNSVGAYLMYSTNVEITENTFRANRGPSGYGLALKDMDHVAVVDNYFIDNRVGIFFDNSPSRVDIIQPIEGNVLAFNDIGVLMMPAVQHNALRNNTFLDNLEQVSLKGGGSNPGESLGANGWDGNYWSDYQGYDAAEDGTGDLAYHAESLFETLADRYPQLGLMHFSPVEQAIDLAAEAFPIIKPKPKLRDETPRMAPVLPSTPPATDPPARGMGWLAAALLLAVGVIYWSQRPPAVVSPVPHRLSLSPRAGNDKVAANVPGVSGPKRMHMDNVLTARETMIRVHNLTKRYAQPGRAWWSDATITAVDDLSFELLAGQTMALWGVNGAGKTTVLKALLGLLDCEGELWLNGYDLRRDGRRARRYFGYVPQELAFHNDLSVGESCRFYARLKGVDAARISVVLELVGMTGQERKAVGALSGGMKQRLALALALLADPPLLLLDEPTSNLDAATREEFLALLVRLHHAGKTLLFTSHHLEDVERLADQVLVLRDGKLLAQGAPVDLTPLLNPQYGHRRRSPVTEAALYDVATERSTESVPVATDAKLPNQLERSTI